MKTDADKVDCHEMQLLATNGQRFVVDPATAMQIVTSPLYLSSLVPFAVLLAMFESPLPGVELAVWARTSIWIVDCALTTAYWLLAFCIALKALAPWKGRVVLPQAILSCLAITAMVWTNWAVAQLAGIATAPAALVWLQALKYAGIAVLFELMSTVALLPRFDGVRFLRGDAEEPEPAPPEVHMLTVNDRRIPVDTLLALKSVEHYVEITTSDQTYMERAPLRDLISQLEAANGIQCHRSYWVSRAAIRGLARRDGNVVLELIDGQDVPVSRGRRPDVEAWLNAPAPLQSA